MILSREKIIVTKCRDADGYRTGTHNTFSSTNPYAKDPVASQNNPTMNPETGTGATQGYNNQATTRAPDTYGSGTGANEPDTYGSGMTGTNTVNAGPHNSKLANKMDPRVDSDLGKLVILVYLESILETY